MPSVAEMADTLVDDHDVVDVAQAAVAGTLDFDSLAWAGTGRW